MIVGFLYKEYSEENGNELQLPTFLKRSQLDELEIADTLLVGIYRENRYTKVGHR